MTQMQPFHRQKTSYREKFLQRQLEQQQPVVVYNNNSKKQPESTMKPSKKGQIAVCGDDNVESVIVKNQSHLQEKIPPIQEEMEAQSELGNNDKDNGNRNEDISKLDEFVHNVGCIRLNEFLQGSGCSTPDAQQQADLEHDAFQQMIFERTKELGLTDVERQCLGICDSKTENANPRRSDEISSPNFTPRSQKISTIGHQNNNNENGVSSTLINLVDQLSFKQWLGAFIASGSGNNSPATGQDSPKGETPDSRTCGNHNGASCDRGACESVLSLIDDICEEEHSNDRAGNNCFKCRYKDSFRSFTLMHLDCLDDISMNKTLSEQDQEEAFRSALEMWIYQLSEQNISLAVAYNESMQASEKLKTVLLQSRNSMRALQKESDKDKAKIEALNYELALREKSIKKLKYEAEMQAEQLRETDDKLEEVQADVQSLTELVIRLRDKGVWDINGLPMGDATFRKIFNGDYYLHGAKVIGHKEYSAKKREWRNEIDQLKSESETLRAIIASKDKEIQKYKTIECSLGRCKN